jgi:hypothetical protein
VISGEVSCPPCSIASTAPTPPAFDADAPQADQDKDKSANDAAVARYDRKAHEYSADLETYRLDLTSYTQWMDNDARDAAVLTSNVLPQFSSDFMGLSTVTDMWAHLRKRYQSSGDVLYLSVVRHERDLRQRDATIDQFYTQSAAILPPARLSSHCCLWYLPVLSDCAL